MLIVVNVVADVLHGGGSPGADDDDDIGARPVRTESGGRVGGLLVSTFALTAILGPLLVGEDPLRQDLANNCAAEASRTGSAPTISAATRSRASCTARASRSASRSRACFAASAWARPWARAATTGLVDRALMRMVDVMLAFPDILLAIVVVATLGKGLGNTIAAVTFFAVPTFARLARGAPAAAAEFVTAAQAVGASTRAFSVATSRRWPCSRFSFRRR
ncbi:MAG: hypothetical protein U0Q12_19855 [Vicinamibacterales bacterium]